VPANATVTISIVAGRSRLIATTRLKGRPVRGVWITVRGPGIDRVAKTGAKGVMRMVIRPRRAGILVIRMADQPARCNTARVGLIGVIFTPVTG
jgi:hypothetical protein